MSTVEEAVAAIRAGEAVVIPTDTVYGLVADGYREAPARALAALKGRPEGTPMALLAAELEVILDAVPELRGRSAVAARALLPGPLTLVLRNPAGRFRWLCGERSDAIGIRVPVLEGDARRVLDRVGAVCSTSANPHGRADPRRLEDVSPGLRGTAGAELDGGELPGMPSTVVDLTGPEPAVLRVGAVPAEDVIARIGEALG